MIESDLRLVHRLVQLDSTSLLQYVSEADLWSNGDARASVDRVAALAREERDEAVRLTRSLQRRHLMVPKVGSYPSHFTTINYVTVDYVLPKLTAELRRYLIELQSFLPLVSDEQVHGWIQDSIAMRERHLQSLSELTVSPTR